MNKEHKYQARVSWTGNRGEGTKTYRGYDRSHTISFQGKPVMECSSDPAFSGDGSKYNPEDLLLASLASCHMLWFLHLCADNGIIVTAYQDSPVGTMHETEGGGHFTEVILYPHVTVTDSSKIEKANQLHDLAQQRCFIANSCNFPVKHIPSCNAK